MVRPDGQPTCSGFVADAFSAGVAMTTATPVTHPTLHKHNRCPICGGYTRRAARGTLLRRMAATSVRALYARRDGGGLPSKRTPTPTRTASSAIAAVACATTRSQRRTGARPSMRRDPRTTPARGSSPRTTIGTKRAPCCARWSAGSQRTSDNAGRMAAGDGSTTLPACAVCCTGCPNYWPRTRPKQCSSARARRTPTRLPYGLVATTNAMGAKNGVTNTANTCGRHIVLRPTTTLTAQASARRAVVTRAASVRCWAAGTAGQSDVTTGSRPAETMTAPRMAARRNGGQQNGRRRAAVVATRGYPRATWRSVAVHRYPTSTHRTRIARTAWRLGLDPRIAASRRNPAAVKLACWK